MTTSKNSRTDRDYPRSHEPIVWSLFGAGGMVIAFIIPALVLITGLLIPLGLVDEPVLAYSRVLAFAQSWWGAMFILICISLPLFHAAHRIYHGLNDLHLHGPDRITLGICYGGATALTVLTAMWLLALV